MDATLLDGARPGAGAAFGNDGWAAAALSRRAAPRGGTPAADTTRRNGRPRASQRRNRSLRTLMTCAGQDRRPASPGILSQMGVGGGSNSNWAHPEFRVRVRWGAIAEAFQLRGTSAHHL